MQFSVAFRVPTPLFGKCGYGDSLARGFFRIFLETGTVELGWVDARFPCSPFLLESPLVCELHWIRHVFTHACPAGDCSLVCQVSSQPLVDRASHALLLVSRVHPDFQPKLSRVKHLHEMLTLPET